MKRGFLRTLDARLLRCTLCLMLAAPLPVAAGVASQGSEGYPFVAGAYTVLPDSGFTSAGAESMLKTKENRLALGLLKIPAGGLAFDFGLDYQYTRYTYENVAGRDRDLHRLQIPLGFSHRTETWSATGFVAPGVATSSNVLKDLPDRGGSDDVITTGRVEIGVPRGARLGWLWGLAYDRAFGEDELYPVLGLTLQWDDRLALRLALPDPAVRYAPRDRHEFTLRLFPAGSEWHVVSDELNDDFAYRVEALRLQGIWSYRFGRSGWLDLSLGYDFDRRFRFVDDAGRFIHSPVESKVLLTVGLRWGNAPITFTHEVARRFFPFGSAGG
jgi:hypothetical protein